VNTVAAYILIQTDVGKSPAVVAAIRALPGVVAAEEVMGSYDVIVRAEAENLDALTKGIVGKVQLIDGITRTLTCPIIHF
jgi:DNA-binding Lrp family transcriptional regulator